MITLEYKIDYLYDYEKTYINAICLNFEKSYSKYILK